MSFAWAKEYEPKSAFTKWIDEKLPVPRLVYNAVGAGYPVPRNLNYMWNFGVLAGFCLMLQIITASFWRCSMNPTPQWRSHRSNTSCAT